MSCSTAALCWCVLASTVLPLHCMLLARSRPEPRWHWSVRSSTSRNIGLLEFLLWALCALAGWALLGDQVQQTISLLLVSAWFICEWWARAEGYRRAELMLIRITVVLAAVYLTGFLGSKRRLVSGVLFAAGAIVLVVGVLVLGDYSLVLADYSSIRYVGQKSPMPSVTLVFAWLCITALPLLIAWRLNRASVLPVAVVSLMAVVLPHLYKQDEGPGWQYPKPLWAAYALVALVAAFLAWWGVQQRSRAMINYGVVCFALVVLWFYFSSIMGKLERSFSLIVLGLLFLGGGWALEKTRRKLVRSIPGAA